MRRLLAACITVLVGAGTVTAQDATSAHPAIAQVRGSVYEVTDGAEHSLVVSTSDGILVVDPLSRATSQWLRERLGAMFPGVPVRYVVLTTPLPERVEGASVFAPAEVIAHREFNQAVAEARRSGDSARFLYVRDVRSTFDTRRALSLGGHEVLLIHPPDTRKKAVAAVYIPDEKLAFTADARPASIGTVPQMSQWLDRVTSVDFDTLILGDGQRLDGTLLRARAAFLRDLLAAVTAGLENGQTADDVTASALVAHHPDLAVPGDRAALVRSLYRSLVWWRLELQGGVAYGHGAGVARDCAANESCQEDTSLPRGTVSAWLSRRRVGVGVESSFGPQAWASITSPAYSEEFAHRQTQTSVLARYVTPRRGALSFAIIGGLALTRADTRGLSIVRETFAPTGGRFSIFEKESRSALVVGVDIGRRLSRAFDVQVPFRLTAIGTGGAGGRWINTSRVQVGLTLSRRLWQGIQ